MCIVQDDVSSKHHQLELMAEIYNRATATLVACSSTNANDQLMTSAAARSAEAMAADVAHYRLTSNTFYKEVLNSTYGQRGWTYQERLLSRRRIYFLKRDVVFHCRMDYMVPVEFGPDFASFASQLQSTKEKKLDGVPLGQQQELWDRTMARFELKRDLIGGPGWAKLNETSWLDGFRFWSTIVKEVSAKDFTYNGDILRACTGILHSFQGLSKWQMEYGTPLPLIELALHWLPQGYGRLFRRRCGSRAIFPSWSWIAWEGNIALDLVTTKDGNLVDFQSRLEFDHFSGHDVFAARQRSIKVVDGIVTAEPYTESRRFSVRAHSPDSANLRFFAYTTKASVVGTILELDQKEPESNISLKIFHRRGAPESAICGYVMAQTEAFETPLTESNDLHLIHLSDTRSSSMGFNLVLAPEIVRNLIEDLGGPSDLWSGIEIPGPSTEDNSNQQITRVEEKPHPVIIGGDWHRWEEDNPNSFGVPMGTIKNIMLVREIRTGIYERVGVGQIVGRTWEKFKPERKLITMV